MKQSCLVLMVLVLGVQAWSFPAQRLTQEDKITIAKERCTPKTATEGVLYKNAFLGFNRSVADLDDMYQRIYNSSDRLVNRVGFFEDEEAFVSKDTFTSTGDRVIFPESLITAVTLQVENSLRLNYVKYVFFPDMGHSHLFIPQDYYEKEVLPAQGLYPSLEAAFKSENLKLLYHTAEQLRMIDDNKVVLKDRYLQWRFYTRNPVGDMNGNIEILTDFDDKGGHNTVRDLENHRYYAGFNISANKNGCFPFQDKFGEIQYFDLSIWDLPYKTVKGGDVGYPFVKGNSGHRNFYVRPQLSTL